MGERHAFATQHPLPGNRPGGVEEFGGSRAAPAPDVNHDLLDFAASRSPAVLYSGRPGSPNVIDFVSANAEAVVGWPAQDLVGSADGWRERVHPDDLALFQSALDRSRRDGAAVQEYRFRTAGGRYVWLRDSWRLTEDTPPGVVGCVIDITAEKETQGKLDRINAINRAIVDAAMDAIIVTDHDGLVIEFNPAAEQMLGYTAEEAVGVLLCDLTMPAEVREQRKESFAQYRLGESGSDISDRFETEVCHRDGSRFPAEIRMRRVSAGTETFIVSEIRDLSERAEAEEARRKVTQLLHDAVENIPVGFAISDADESLVLCNQAFAEPYGEPPDKLIGMSRRDLLARLYPKVRGFDGVRVESEEDYLAMVSERLDTAGSRHIEVEVDNGEWLLVSAFRTSDGGIVTIRTDITKLKRAENALRDSEMTIRAAVEACPVPLGLVRAHDGLIIYQSPAAQKLFGGPPGDGPAYTTGYFVREADRQRFLKAVTGNGVDGMEALMKRADGSEFWASVSARLVEFLGRKSIVTSVYDLTERRAVEAEMTRQREALHQSEKLAALGELLASVAHELNNPLSVVVGQALLLKETATDPSISQRAEKIGSAADRCSRIVRTFLAMARQQPMERRPVDLNQVVELALEVTAYSLRAADIDVRLSLDDQLPSVWGDADQLNQTLTNLILNAQKALEDSKLPRRVEIVTRYVAGAREVILEIRDNGPGIPESIRSRIFEPFFTTRQVGSGTGIGLAFCHRIITTHGGMIEADSGIDGGASFVIRLPVTRASGDTAAEIPGGEVASSTAKVLVVDDEVAVAEMMADMLADDGHEVEIAHSGSQALDVIALRSFDLVLSDLRMPDLDGPAMFDAIREARPDLVSRIAFITGDTMSSRIRMFLSESGRPYIEKPITPQDVRDLVEQMLHETKNANKELEQ